ncbi:MAG TPA: glycosyltransferase family protein [Stellaceae bacterium]|nr:glycosyltransferase family protein [Stellaceae bacterium]
MVTAVIVQARLGSSRLPAKVLKPLGGATVLESVLNRCRRISGVDVVVCAVPNERESDAIAGIAGGTGATVFRGSPLDLLDRYFQAARAIGANLVMRVTSDCPLIDPDVCADVLALLRQTSADYACNNMPPLWPHGLDCDAFSFDWLAKAAAKADAPYDREHVTPWLRRNPEVHRVNLDGPGGGAERHRWTLDFPEDYAFFEALWQLLGDAAATVSTADLLGILAAHPEIVEINRHRIDERRLADTTAVAQLRVPYPAAVSRNS